MVDGFGGKERYLRRIPDIPTLHLPDAPVDPLEHTRPAGDKRLQQVEIIYLKRGRHERIDVAEGRQKRVSKTPGLAGLVFIFRGIVCWRAIIGAEDVGRGREQRGVGDNFPGWVSAS